MSVEFVFPWNKVASWREKDLGSDTPRFKSRLCFLLTVTLSQRFVLFEPYSSPPQLGVTVSIQWGLSST